ncbi:hypothetical protein [Pendulispora albinea]|uniref:Dickkopf N-terminal cysteine-rich domain-containing protein n=1 Tax=Pendulispora albinea TaxID=2741071 RepID=A0ABZ2LUX6_9BACT
MDRRGWHALGRLSGVSSFVALIGSVLWAGCSDEDRYYCDSTGCYQCSGYGCTPAPTKDGGSGPSPLDGGSSRVDAGKSDSGTKPGPQCRYSSECPADKSCVNGQCVPTCSETKPCSPGNKCVTGVCQPDPGQPQCRVDSECSNAAPKCVNGQCVPACTEDKDCPEGKYCNPDGACVPDTRPKPNCSPTDTSACNANQTCLDGYCKYRCDSDAYCKRIDARIGWCASDGVCRTQNEAHPQCTRGDQCKAPQLCIDNVCR